jgi:hypothetical protein
MKTLSESLFDNNLVEKDILENPEFKKWINQPNTLWYIYYYWECGEEDWLNDFMKEDWRVYKPLVDELLEIITNSMGKVYTWYMINLDQFYYSDEVKDKFADEAEFYDMMNDANSIIIHSRSETKDGISKSGFRGPLPKNSSVTALLQQLEEKFTKPGLVDGGFFLTNEDTIIVLAFPKRTPKNILKLFNLD